MGRKWDLEWTQDGQNWVAIHEGTTIRVSRSHGCGRDVYIVLEREFGACPHIVRLAAGCHIMAEDFPGWIGWALEAVCGASLGTGETL
jgi:hypothetical protein